MERLLPRARKHAPNVANHLERAVDSVLFNIAEGSASWRPRIKLNAYDTSRREASEVRAALRRLMMKRVHTFAEIRRAYGLAGACIAMLTNAMKAVERRLDD